MTSRREFFQQTVAAGVGLSLPRSAAGQPPAGFLDIRRPPDAVIVRAAGVDRQLSRSAEQWSGSGTTVTTAAGAEGLRVRLAAPSTPVMRLHLRWRGDTSAVQLLLGDAWERAYGDLEWRGLVADRAMPWYFAAFDGHVTHAYGVRTSPKAFCWWQLDVHGISLFADVRSGGAGVELGPRVLDVCDVVCRAGRPGESAFAALHAFCGDMCDRPRRPAAPVYGSNDWYWAYGKNSAATIRVDAERIVNLSPPGGNRPFAVIDDGWQPEREDDTLAGVWNRGNAKFGEMADVASAIRRADARPGVWIRPLLASADTPASWRLPRDRAVLDPTIPEAAAKIGEDIARLRAWGFDLIKHDYTTFDLFGRWGSQMGTDLTKSGWTFARGADRTTAEVIDALYRVIREAAGDGVVIGCNTVSHLSAGVFDVCRIGDDTSGTRLVPHAEDGRQLAGVSRSPTRRLLRGGCRLRGCDERRSLGAGPAVAGPCRAEWDVVVRVACAGRRDGRSRRDLRAALAIASSGPSLGEPLDWQRTTWPSSWRLMGGEKRYDWIEPDGVAPR